MIRPQTNRNTATMKLEPSSRRLGGKGGKNDEKADGFRCRARRADARCGLYGNGLGGPRGVNPPKQSSPTARGKGVTALCLN